MTYFSPPRTRELDTNGKPLSGARRYYFDAGTTNPLTVYVDSARQVPHAHPVLADAAGLFPAIYLPNVATYKVELRTADDVLLTSDDDVPVGATGTVTPGPGTGGSGSTLRPVTLLTEATTLSAADWGKQFVVDPTSGDFTVTMPSAVDANGQQIEFLHRGSGTVTLDGFGTQTINGGSILELDAPGNFAITTADGADMTALVREDGPGTVTLDDLASDVRGSLVPVGVSFPWAHETAPPGYLLCQGQSVSRAAYPKLFAVIGTRYGAVDVDSFSMPDYRGMVLRGRNAGRADAFADPDAATRDAPNQTGATGTGGDVVGSTQLDTVGPHTHPVSNDSRQNGRVAGSEATLTPENDAFTGENNPGGETRVKNTYVDWIMFASPDEAAGASGVVNRMITADRAPAQSDGIDGDMFVDTSTNPFTIYGPKSAGVWSSSATIGVRQRGAWAVGTSYGVNDIVQHAGATYIVNTLHTSTTATTPGVGNETTLIARNGTDGTNGVDGQNGTNGTDGQNGADGQDGAPGTPGAPGAPGTNGTDGQDGRDGAALLATVWDQKAVGTDGGTFTAGARRTRDLTQSADPSGSIQLANNRVALPAGDYLLRMTAPAGSVGRHQAFVRDVAGGVDVLTGSPASPGDTSDAFAFVSFANAAELEVQHQCTTTRAADGFGEAASFGAEIYTRLEIFAGQTGQIGSGGGLTWTQNQW